jgi:hypothetical protein
MIKIFGYILILYSTFLMIYEPDQRYYITIVKTIFISYVLLKLRKFILSIFISYIIIITSIISYQISNIIFIYSSILYIIVLIMFIIMAICIKKIIDDIELISFKQKNIHAVSIMFIYILIINIILSSIISCIY